MVFVLKANARSGGTPTMAATRSTRGSPGRTRSMPLMRRLSMDGFIPARAAIWYCRSRESLTAARSSVLTMLLVWHTHTATVSPQSFGSQRPGRRHEGQNICLIPGVATGAGKRRDSP